MIKNTPNLYNAMFSFYKQELEILVKPEIEHVYILSTAVTPACNMALLFHSIAFFLNKAIPLYVNEKTQTAVKLESTGQFLNHFEKQEVLTHLNSYNYAAIDINNLLQQVIDFFNFKILEITFDPMNESIKKEF